MAEYDKTNTGVLFINDRKEKPNHPDRKGSINIDGVEYWLSGWVKDGPKGKYMSLAATPKDGQSVGQPAKKPAKQTADFDDSDSIPF